MSASQARVALTKHERIALRQIAGRAQPYWWNRTAMATLAACGYVEVWPGTAGLARPAYRVTAEGRAALGREASPSVAAGALYGPGFGAVAKQQRAMTESQA